MLNAEVAIVGGGPAGSSCAARLVRAGASAIVVDRARFPRDKPCAGWIVPQVLDTLHLDPAEYASTGRIIQPITGFLTGVIGGRAVETSFDAPVSYGIRRCEFDEYLLGRSGATLVQGEAVSSIERERGDWIINGQVRAPMLVGAGGHLCPVARHINGKEVAPRTRLVGAQEIEYRLASASESSVDPEIPELYFCEDLEGYGWCFRKGDYLNIGLGRIAGRGLAEALARFVRWLKEVGRIAADPPQNWRGHSYLLTGAGRKIVGDGVLLAGDAAGIAWPQSGEGIRPAIESGILAAEAIAGAKGRYAESDLAPYAKAIASRFNDGSIVPRVASAAPALARALGRRALSVEWFVRHVVLERWFLHMNDAPLPGLGTRDPALAGSGARGPKS